MRLRSLGFLVIMVIPVTSLLAAEPDPPVPLAERINELTADYRTKRPFGALSVGVIQNDRKEVFGYGQIDHNGKKADVNGRTLFEIASCTKVFTSLSLAVLVTRGEVKLDDPIQSLMPNVPLSDDAARITLRELSTHTSGLPRIPLGLLIGAIFSSKNPYKDFTADHLMAVLKKWKAPSRKTSVYSNLGAGLLGYVLQQKVGAENYEALISSTVAEPLGLKDTVVTLSDEQQARYATGHNLKGKPVNNWDFQALAGAGALRSTADDMLSFLQNQLHPEQSPLQAALELSQKKHHEGKQGTIGLGWQISERVGRTLLWHNGGTGGYRSFIGLERKTGVAVVLLSNTGDAFAQDESIDRMGLELLKTLSP